MQSQENSYHADIHHFDSTYKGKLIDDDGDTLRGWYYQIVKNDKDPVTQLIGPYPDEEQCQNAAIKEYEKL